MTNFEYQFKLVLIGHDKSGKSSIISRFVSNTYASSYVATIGTDFKVCNLNVVDKVCQLQIWDTAGLSCFQSAPETVYRNAQGVFICYDVTSRASFDSVPKWLHQAQSHAPLSAVIYIIGCKCEASAYNRRVSREEGEQLAAAKGCRFGECSAKNNINVEQIYSEMCILLRDQADQEAENALLVHRNTLTEGNKVLQSAYAVHISGATSWYNATKINGRYVPQMSKTAGSTAAAQAEEFSFVNTDSPGSVMVYRDNTWVIRVHRKPLARVSSTSILQFPDVASVKNVWFENTGVYFTWWHARPAIKCVLLHAGHQGSFSGNKSGNIRSSGTNAGSNNISNNNSISIKRSASNKSIFGACSSAGSAGSAGSSGGKGTATQRASVAAGVLATGSPPLDIFAGARGAQGGINMELFTQCCKEPSRLGLSSPLFVQYCVIRLAMLEYERKYMVSNSSVYDSRAMLHICAQLQRVQDTVREMAAALKIDLTLSTNNADAVVNTTGVNLSANTSANASAHPSSGSAKVSGLADPTTPRSPGSPTAAIPPASPSASTSASVAPQASILALAPPPPPLPYGPLLEVSADAITAAIKDLLRPLSRHLALLCDVGESGNFEQARRCRDVRVEVEQYVLDLQQQPQQRTSFSFSGRNSFSARNSFSGGSNRGSFSRSSFSGRNSFSGTPVPPPTNVVAK